MQKLPTKIRGAWILSPKILHDERGFFLESWNRETFRALGLDADFMQDNHSRSTKNVLRGLHYQIGDAAQTKLVWVTSGSVFDVIVDLRQSSPTFGQWEGHALDAESHRCLWVPAGCAHGFLALSDSCDFHYKTNAPYDAAAERALRWDDADLGIAWPVGIGIAPVVSSKDAAAATFADCDKYA
jgi:dTDP-4-dehydrorhamnose 3,5-epimerase